MLISPELPFFPIHVILIYGSGFLDVCKLLVFF